MKITRNGKSTVRANSERDTRKRTRVTANDSKSEAVEYIRSAISVLGESAIAGDTESKDAIADLSVILFDLKD